LANVLCKARNPITGKLIPESDCRPNPNHPNCKICEIFHNISNSQDPSIQKKPILPQKDAAKARIAGKSGKSEPSKENRQIQENNPIWSTGGSYPSMQSKHGGDIDFSILAKLINLSELTPEIHKELSNIADQYYLEKAFWLNQPKPKDIEEIFQNTMTSCKFLIDRLEDPLFREMLGRYSRQGKWLDEDNEEIKSVLEGLKKITSTTKDSIRIIKPGKSGRPTSFALYNCLNALFIFYKRQTGEKFGITKDPYNHGYGGKKYQFIENFFKIIDPSVLEGDKSLGRNIERALNKLKNPRRDKKQASPTGPPLLIISPICEKEFSSPNRLSKHILQNHPQEPIQIRPVNFSL
jgi:hypothetical protein